ncbi:DrmB family protein [Streptomyces sp. NPDC003996]
MNATVRLGELRPNQLLHTFGVGAIADLPNLSVMVLGLDGWQLDRADIVREERLLAAVRKVLGPQVDTLRTPPYTPEDSDPFGDWSRIGVPVGLFPRWLRCSNPQCNRLAPVVSGLFELVTNAYAPDKIRYVHNCRGNGRNRPTAVPARFVLACPDGHMDDFPWVYFVHRGADPCPDGTLKLIGRGTTGEVTSVYVECSCGARRAMSEAYGEAAERNLPACRGRHPHLGSFEPCGTAARTVALGATNSWFAMQMRVFSLPRAVEPLDHAVAEHWGQLELLAPLPEEVALGLMPSLQCWPMLEPFGRAAVMKAVRRKAAAANAPASEGDDVLDLAAPEWQAFTDPRDVELPDFTTRRTAVPAGTGDWLDEVVLVPRLREVAALYGFARIDAPEWGVVDTEEYRRAPLSSHAPTWLPCAEIRGEGIFLRFNEDRIASWEQRPDVAARQAVLQSAHRSWRAQRHLEPEEGWPGARYLLLHTVSHVLIRQLALEAGYSAAGISERIYARTGPEPMAGILLYTAAPDSEGTLGGLVGLGDPDRLGPLLEQALDAASLCSSDPLCAEHDPRGHGRLYGAACHACLFAAETTCERGNQYLDRALVVDTLTGPAVGFFKR